MSLKKRYKCLMCCRDKFEKPVPHCCRGGHYIKHYIRVWRKNGNEGSPFVELSDGKKGGMSKILTITMERG